MTSVKYIHHTPGRLRVRGNHFKKPGESARRAMALLQAMDGVESVKLNIHASSLTIHYDPKVHGQPELLAALEAAGCLRLAAASLPKRPLLGGMTSGEGVAGAFGKALVGALAQRTATRVIGVLL